MAYAACDRPVAHRPGTCLQTKHPTDYFGRQSSTVHRTGRDCRTPKTHAASAAKEGSMARNPGRGPVRRGNGGTRLAPVVFLAVLAGVAAPSRTHAATCAPVDHGPILIGSDRDFTAANGVASGSGTAADPYVFSNLKLNDLTPGYGLKVDNSRGRVTKFFNVQCVQSIFQTAPPKGANLIWLVGVGRTTRISDVSANSGEDVASTGVRLDSSSYVTLDSLSINKFGVDGVQLNSSSNITILHSKLKAMHNGVSILNSHDISMGDPCDLSAVDGTCNDFTYDDGRGIYALNSYNISAQYTKTNADDTGGILLDGSGTFSVTLTNGVASGNGPICPMGVPTGDKVDTNAGIAVINGAHDINVKGYTINGNVIDIMNGGNDLYYNPCTGLFEPLKGKATPPGGGGLDFNGTCYHTQFGFFPVPASSCP